MLKKEEQLNILDTMITDAANKGLVQITVEDEFLDGRTIHINNKPIVNFGSCSYLGLETDERVKQGAIDAINRYGTQFSSSRTYISAPLYKELEELLEAQFGYPTLTTPNTAIAHISAIPILVQEGDVVIMDQLIHASVKTAIQLLYPYKIKVELLLHNRMDLLEEKIEELRKTYKNIWYFTDGIYSMHGDLAKYEELKLLLNRYEQLHLYIDDAHGMSWTGTNGTGTVLDNLGMHPRIVISTSLNKSFAAAGGALILPSHEQKRLIQTCGGPLIFSGPIQPPMLGAAVASAKIHLSSEIITIQDELKKRLDYCNQLMHEYCLPLYSFSGVPIHFVAMGLPKVTHNMAKRLLNDGFYTNVATFPAVPMKKSGVRFTITRHHSMDDIRNLVQAMAKHFPAVMEEENTSLQDIERAFKIKIIKNTAENKQPQQSKIETNLSSQPVEFSMQHETTIQQIEQNEWDKLLGANGSFTWEGLDFLEKTFRDNPEPENNWNFHYYIIRDAGGIPVLATFFTEALWKDDMLASKEISEIVETKRINDPYFLTSRVLAMGSLLTEGQHLYLDKKKDWQKAMNMLLSAISQEQERCGAATLVLRDFPTDAPDMDEFMLKAGFIKQAMPDSMTVNINWDNYEEYLQSLSKNARRHQKYKVLPYLDMFDIEIIKKDKIVPTQTELEYFYQLYKNVKNKSLDLNTFSLPKKIFENMLNFPSWELIILKLKPHKLPVFVGGCFINSKNYCPIFIGIDYNYAFSHNTYRVALHTALVRAKELKLNNVFLGFGANLEKHRFGAKVKHQCSYIQVSNHYNFDILENLKNNIII